MLFTETVNGGLYNQELTYEWNGNMHQGNANTHLKPSKSTVEKDSSVERSAEPIAIVGFGCRLPGKAASPDGLWQLLLAGESSHGSIPRSRFNAEGFYHPDALRPGSLSSLGGYFLSDDIRAFDNAFFGISNLEASHIDPQQRQLLEVVYECLESAGHTIESLNGSNTGVFVGNFTTDYQLLQLKDPEFVSRFNATGSAPSIIANRISNVFNLHGPSVVLDTACSSSLYGVHIACNALASGDCDSAIVGSANLIQSPEMHLQAIKAGFLSADSTCHTFDTSANGYGRAEGVGAIFLKRLSDAIHDNDAIRAVIRGTAANSNGKTTGMSLPDADMQAAVIRKAHAKAGVDMLETQYVEAHGTGTPVGDPIEVEGLVKAFARTPQDPKLLIGSIKSNLGHSEAASGLSSIIKMILAFENGQIPPTIGIRALNPKVKQFEDRVAVVRSRISWPKAGIRRAGVNSFGFGGANAHAVLESAEQYCGASENRSSSSMGIPEVLLIPLSAYCESSLQVMTENYTSVMQKPIKNLTNFVYTVSARKSKLQHRTYAIVETSELIQSSGNSSISFTPGRKVYNDNPKDIVFVFPGQGAQWQGMAADLMSQFPIFRASVLKLDRYLSNLPEGPDWSLQMLFGKESSAWDINTPTISQPICTAVQIALVDLLASWKITPQAVFGHSSGEIAAAYSAGAITANEAIAIAYYRGLYADRYAQKGLMIAVGIDAETAQNTIYELGLESETWLACVNSNENVTLSGKAAAIEKLRLYFDSRNTFVRMISTGQMAYHSPCMEQAGDIYEATLMGILDHQSAFTDCFVPMVSTVTTHELPLERLRCASYWKDNMLSTVHFHDVATQVLSSSNQLVVEVGAHSLLKVPLKQIWAQTNGSKELPYVPTLLRNTSPLGALLKFSGELFIRGVAIPIEKVNRVEHGSVMTDLPKYPWYHNGVLWHEPRSSRELREREYPRHYLLGSRLIGSSGITKTWRNIIRSSDINWLVDHCLESTIVVPGAAYVSIAIEGLRQCLGLHKLVDTIVLKQVFINKALAIPEEDGGIELLTYMSPTQLSATSLSKKWFSFEISSVNGGNTVIHATGQICTDVDDRNPQAVKQQDDDVYSLRLEAKEMYRKFHEVGLFFGPSFETIAEARFIDSKHPGSAMKSETTIKAFGGQLLPANYSEDVLHPSLLDSIFQTAAISDIAGKTGNIKSRLPVFIKEITIDPSRTNLGHATIRAHSQYRGYGTLDCSAIMLDGNGYPVLGLNGLRLLEQDIRLSSSDMVSRRPLQRVSWQPDVDCLEPKHMEALGLYFDANLSAGGECSGQQWLQYLNGFLQLICHKRPDCKIIVIGNEDNKTIFNHIIPLLRPLDGLQRFGSISYATLEDGCLKVLSTTHISETCMSFSDLDFQETNLEVFYDLSIVLNDLVHLKLFASNHQRVQHIPARKGFVAFTGSAAEDMTSDGTFDILYQKKFSDEDATYEQILIGRSKDQADQINGVNTSNLDVYVVHDDDSNHFAIQIHNHINAQYGLQSQTIPFDRPTLSQIPDASVLIMTIEMFHPLLDSITQSQFEALQNMLIRATTVLWLIRDDYLKATSPDTTLAFGLSRGLMLEQPSLKFPLLSLDTASMLPQAQESAFQDVVSTLRAANTGSNLEFELVRSNGLLYCSRFVVDPVYNREFRIKQSGSLDKRKIQNIENWQLECRAPGQLGLLYFREIPALVGPPEEGYVDVSIQNVGLNYKDLTVAFSSIDTKDGNCCLDFSGRVSSVPTPSSPVQNGDRVAVMAPGKLRRSERVPVWACQKLRDGEDAKELATLPIIFATAIHALESIAKLQSGESVLIHSAAGGLGQAAIQIAQMIGATIYATVGTQEKRAFLTSRYGIAPSRIFNSHDDSFLKEVMQITCGEGVDVVLNSLTGDLLHASVQCCAQFGHFIEVGRRDIAESGILDMSAFSRNITFSAFDLSHYYYSHKQKHNMIWADLLAKVIALYRLGKIKAVGPLSTFDVSQISAGFSSLISATRMGKIVITFENQDSEVSVLPPKFETKFNPAKEYLLIGGLGGLGRSISKWMVQQGARYLTFLSRTGSSKGESRQHIETLEKSGVCVRVVKGSVDKLEDITRILTEKNLPLGGVVHAAMDLDEALFANLSAEKWHKVLRPKLQGTRNLHQALGPYEDELDFFVMTSSINGSVGSATETNYCAANSFLDNFARYRRIRGLKAVSIGLGMISEVGYLHEHPDIQKLLLRRGVHPINQDEMLQIFDIALKTENSLTMEMPGEIPGCFPGHILTGLEAIGIEEQREMGYEGDIAVLRDARASLLARNQAAATRSRSKTSQADAVLALLAKLQQNEEIDRSVVRTAVIENVREKLSNLLLTPLDQLEEQTLLSEFGMDSMLGSEFRAHVFHKLQVDVPFMTLLEVTTSIGSLADLILGEVEKRQRQKN